MSNDWTKPLTLGAVTFEPASQDGTFECPKRVYSGGYGHGHGCGRQVVTIISGAKRNDDGARCAVHAAAVKRRVQNDLDRQAKARESQRLRDARRVARDEAVKRLEAHGLNVPPFGDFDLTDLANQLDRLQQGWGGGAS